MRILFLSAALSMAWLVASPASQAAPSPKSLVEVADLDDVAISPDGRSVAFRQYRASVESNRYDLAWLVAPIGAGGSVVRVADGGEPLFTDAGTVVVEPPPGRPTAASSTTVRSWAARCRSGERPLTDPGPKPSPTMRPT